MKKLNFFIALFIAVINANGQNTHQAELIDEIECSRGSNYEKSKIDYSYVTEKDSLALVALYKSTKGGGWRNNSRWLEYPVYDWYGIDVWRGRVVKIRLGNNELSGALPPELGDLDSLNELTLFNNSLGSSIPSELGNLAVLERLYLSGNSLSGSIPSELGNLNSLVELCLGNNQLTGSIPLEFGNLSSLENLDLDQNELTGPIPSEIGNMTSLDRIYLFDNKLSGEIPAELGNLSNLSQLWLDQNQLTGEIPSELGNLAKLKDLILYMNQLTGSIPTEIGNLTTLTTLNLSYNQFSGVVPPELGNLSNLTILSLFQCNLSGIFDLTNLNGLKYLWIGENNLIFQDLEDLKFDFNLLNEFNYSPQNILQLIDDEIVANIGEEVIIDFQSLLVENLENAKNEYAIYFYNNIVQDWCNSQLYTVSSFASTDVGKYSIKVRNSDYPELILTSEEVYITDIKTDINSIGDEKWSVYPNPSSGIFVLDIDIAKYLLKVYNSNGKLVFQEVIDQSKNTIDLTDMNAGVYFIVVQNEKNIFSKKVIIK